MMHLNYARRPHFPATASVPSRSRACIAACVASVLATCVAAQIFDADALALGAVIAQYLRFDLDGEGHAFSARVGCGEPMSGRSPGAPRTTRDNGNEGNAMVPG